MRKLLLLISILFLSEYAQAVQYEYLYRNTTDSSYNCYLKCTPDSGQIKGLVIRDFTNLPKINKKSKYKLTDLCIENGLMVLYTCSSNYFPELCYTDAPLYLIDQMAAMVIAEHNIPKQNIFIGGISASGTRALQYAKFCKQGKSQSGIMIRGVFSVDSPLDFERFYNSAKNNGHKFKKGMAWEAKLMTRVFPERLGTPEKNLYNYQSRSVYSQFAKDGGNAIHFKNIDVLFFHEPDLDWWQEERGASYYDINSFDINGFVDQLEKIGNKNITLVTTSGKGFDKEGNRKCHSWSIVDEDFLMNWILARMNK